jgi:hypothetical protein
MLQELRAFRQKFGHCRVPADYFEDRLVQWVRSRSLAEPGIRTESCSFDHSACPAHLLSTSGWDSGRCATRKCGGSAGHFQSSGRGCAALPPCSPLRSLHSQQARAPLDAGSGCARHLVRMRGQMLDDIGFEWRDDETDDRGSGVKATADAERRRTWSEMWWAAARWTQAFGNSTYVCTLSNFRLAHQGGRGGPPGRMRVKCDTSGVLDVFFPFILVGSDSWPGSTCK